MIDFGVQRLNMVESQVRPSDLTDRRIANAMLATPREAYLPETLHGVAYSDGELRLELAKDKPIETGARGVLSPRTVSQMIQALNLEAEDIVLLIGAGSGYEAALLAQIAQTVVSVESEAGLAEHAETVLQEQGVGNAVVVQGALSDGVAGEGPFDAIMINGGVDAVGDGLLDQLKDGGRLVAIRREAGVTRLTRWQRIGERFSISAQAAAAADILPEFAAEAAFVF